MSAVGVFSRLSAWAQRSDKKFSPAINRTKTSQRIGSKAPDFFLFKAGTLVMDRADVLHARVAHRSKSTFFSRGAEALVEDKAGSSQARVEH